MNGTKWGRVDVMTLVSYVDATGTNKADVLATDRGGSIKVCAKMGTHRTTPPIRRFYISGFAQNSNCVWATVRPRSPTPRQALIHGK